MKRAHLRGSRRRGRPTSEPTLQRPEDFDHFTARLVPVAGTQLARRRRMRHTPQSGRLSIISPLASPLGAARLALRPPSIWTLLIGLRCLTHTEEPPR